jgi:hypothetical protein
MRILSLSEASSLLAYFPKTRLSYEISIHKKDETYNNECFIIPKGKRCLAWATEWNRQKIIAIIEIAPSLHHGPTKRNTKYNTYDSRSNNRADPNNHFHQFTTQHGWTPGQVLLYDACFHSSLSYGTLFGGAIFKTHKNNTQISCFCIQHIYWYKGNPVSTLRFDDYTRLSAQIFLDKDIIQISYTSSSIIFGLPVMCDNENAAEHIIQTLPYPVYSIQFRSNHDISIARVHQKVIQNNVQRPSATSCITSDATLKYTTPISKDISIEENISEDKILFVKPNDEMLTNIQAVFIVRPNIQNDIYELFVTSTTRTRSSSEYIFHSFAHIPNYKTSVMMNNLFRKIKENDRLDSMEESDEDEEFENTDPGKFVISFKTEYVMICRLNKKFCKWVPISIAASSATIVTDIQVKQHEVRYLSKKWNGPK